MTDLRETFLAAVALVTEQTEIREPGDWTRPSPCAGWDARDVLVHVTGTVGKTLDMLGESGSYAPVPASTEKVEPDEVVRNWQQVAAAASDAVAAADPEQVVQTPFGQASVGTALGLPTSDCAVHAWDIAASVGRSLELPQVLLNHVDGFAHSVPEETLRNPQVFGPEVPAPPGASATERLMAWLGRERP